MNNDTIPAFPKNEYVAPSAPGPDRNKKISDETGAIEDLFKKTHPESHSDTTSQEEHPIHPTHAKKIVEHVDHSLMSSLPISRDRLKDSFSPSPAPGEPSSSPGLGNAQVSTPTTLRTSTPIKSYSFLINQQEIQQNIPNIPLTYSLRQLNHLRPYENSLPVPLFSDQWHEILNLDDEHAHPLQMSSHELFKVEEHGERGGMTIGNWTDEVHTIVRRLQEQNSIIQATFPNPATLQQNEQELLFLIAYKGPKENHPKGYHSISEQEKVDRLVTLLNSCFPNQPESVIAFLSALGRSDAPPDIHWRVCSMCDQYIDALKKQNFQLLGTISSEQNWVLAHVQKRMEESLPFEPLPQPIEQQPSFSPATALNLPVAAYSSQLPQEAVPQEEASSTSRTDFFHTTASDASELSKILLLSRPIEALQDNNPIVIEDIGPLSFTFGKPPQTEAIDAFSDRYNEVKDTTTFEPILKKISQGLFFRSSQSRPSNWKDRIKEIQERIMNMSSISQAQISPGSASPPELVSQLVFLITHPGRKEDANTVGEEEKCQRLAILLKECVPDARILLNIFFTIGKQSALPEETQERILGICDALIPHLQEAGIELPSTIAEEQNWVLSHIQDALDQAYF